MVGIGIGISSQFQQLEFLVKSINISVSDDRDIDSVCYGITNFEFFGTESVETRNGENISKSRAAMRLKLHGKEVQINKITNYEESINQIKLSRDANITCKLLMKLSENDLDENMEMVNNLCYLMSIIRGTKVAWIYYTAYSRGKIIRKVHLDGNVKRYNPLPLLEESWDAGNSVRSFLEVTYDTFVSRLNRFHLKEIIDVYLDAKAEGDLIEMRGAKLAVVMEKLKAILVNSRGLVKDNSYIGHSGEYILSPDDFDLLKEYVQKNLKAYLKKNGINGEIRGKIYKNITCLNRTKFEDLLGELWDEIDLSLQERDIRLFINSRNSLIHKGLFYCESKEFDDRCEPLANRDEEYYFILNMLDKTMLKLVGYSGPRINYLDLARSEGLSDNTKLLWVNEAKP